MTRRPWKPLPATVPIGPKGCVLTYRASDRDEAPIRGRSPTAEPGTGDRAPPQLVFFLHLAEVRLELLEALDKTGQVVFVGQLATVRGGALDAPDLSHLLEVRNVPLHLAGTEAQPIGERLLAGKGLAVGIPPVVAELDQHRELGGESARRRWARTSSEGMTQKPSLITAAPHMRGGSFKCITLLKQHLR